MALPPAVFDRHIPSLDVAGFPQSLEERVHKRCRGRAGELGVEDADHRHRLLLRARGERRDNKAKSEHDREPDPPHKHLSWMAGGSLADLTMGGFTRKTRSMRARGARGGLGHCALTSPSARDAKMLKAKARCQYPFKPYPKRKSATTSRFVAL